MFKCGQWQPYMYEVLSFYKIHATMPQCCVYRCKTRSASMPRSLTSSMAVMRSAATCSSATMLRHAALGCLLVGLHQVTLSCHGQPASNTPYFTLLTSVGNMSSAQASVIAVSFARLKLHMHMLEPLLQNKQWRTFCIMGQRLNNDSKLKLSSGGLVNTSLKQACFLTIKIVIGEQDSYLGTGVGGVVAV